MSENRNIHIGPFYPFGGIIADISTGTSELMAGSYMDGTDTIKV